MWCLPCDFTGLCTNTCPTRSECPKRRMKLYFYTVVTDDFSAYDEVYINYGAVHLAQGYPEKTTEIKCANPACNNNIVLSKVAETDLLGGFSDRYHKKSMPVCCKECAKKVIANYWKHKPNLN